jgi:hypothetical protein
MIIIFTNLRLTAEIAMGVIWDFHDRESMMQVV